MLEVIVAYARECLKSSSHMHASACFPDGLLCRLLAHIHIPRDQGTRQLRSTRKQRTTDNHMYTAMPSRIRKTCVHPHAVQIEAVGSHVRVHGEEFAIRRTRHGTGNRQPDIKHASGESGDVKGTEHGSPKEVAGPAGHASKGSQDEGPAGSRDIGRRGGRDRHAPARDHAHGSSYVGVPRAGVRAVQPFDHHSAATAAAQQQHKSPQHSQSQTHASSQLAGDFPPGWHQVSGDDVHASKHSGRHLLELGQQPLGQQRHSRTEKVNAAGDGSEEARAIRAKGVDTVLREERATKEMQERLQQAAKGQLLCQVRAPCAQSQTCCH
jgi:hypothetical protein